MRKAYAQVYRVGGTDGYGHVSFNDTPYIAASLWKGTVWGSEGEGALAETATYGEPGGAMEELSALAKMYGVTDVRPWSGAPTP